MASLVTNSTSIQPQLAAQPPVRQPAPVPQPPVASKLQPQPPVTDTVRISPAAKALQELTETSAQTAREARSGDVQAQRLLAKETAAQAAAK